MLGISKINSFTIDLWQGQSHLFYCDGIKICTKSDANDHSVEKIELQNLDQSKLSELIEQSMSRSIRHLSIESKCFQKDSFEKLLASFQNNSMTSKNIRVTFIISENEDYFYFQEKLGSLNLESS